MRHVVLNRRQSRQYRGDQERLCMFSLSALPSSRGSKRTPESQLSPFKLVFLVLLSALSLANKAHAQFDAAEVVGTIRDTTGAVISGAAVTLRNLKQGTTEHRAADANGDFDFVGVQIGGLHSLGRETRLLHLKQRRVPSPGCRKATSRSRTQDRPGESDHNSFCGSYTIGNRHERSRRSDRSP